MQFFTMKPDGKINYDDFIRTMDINIRERRNSLNHLVEDQIFSKINECIEHSGESLYESMKVYDTKDDGMI